MRHEHMTPEERDEYDALMYEAGYDESDKPRPSAEIGPRILALLDDAADQAHRVWAKGVRALNVAELAARLGLHEWQVHRGADEQILPARDRSRGWSADLADRLAERYANPDNLDALRARIGLVPDMGAWDMGQYLQGWLGLDKRPESDTIREVARRGHLEVFWGDGRGHAVYSGRTIEAFAARADVRKILTEAAVAGETLTTDQAAERLGIRRSDFDHLTRAGLIRPVRIGLTGHWAKSRDPGLPLYRAGSVDDLSARADIDWAAVRATPRGRRSPLAKLPTARRED